MSQYETLQVEARGAIEILSLHRPAEYNAVNPGMLTELSNYFDACHRRTDVRVVLLRGNGKHFCAGADLASGAFVQEEDGRAQRQMEMQKLYSRLIRLMRGCPQPIITLIHGAACGAGFSMLLASDVRFATPDARMNAAYIRVGLGGCDMGAGYLLPRLIGLSMASELLLTGRFLDATRAKAIGLVSDVVAEDRLLEAGLAFAGEMLLTAPMGLRLTKEALNALIDAPGLEAALMLEDRQQVILLETQDHREAVAAFFERRAPAYRDR